MLHPGFSVSLALLFPEVVGLFLVHCPLALKKALGLQAVCEQLLLSQGKGGTICKLAGESSLEYASKHAPVPDYAIDLSQLLKNYRAPELENHTG